MHLVQLHAAPVTLSLRLPLPACMGDPVSLTCNLRDRGGVGGSCCTAGSGQEAEALVGVKRSPHVAPALLRSRLRTVGGTDGSAGTERRAVAWGPVCRYLCSTNCMPSGLCGPQLLGLPLSCRGLSVPIDSHQTPPGGTTHTPGGTTHTPCVSPYSRAPRGPAEGSLSTVQAQCRQLQVVLDYRDEQGRQAVT